MLDLRVHGIEVAESRRRIAVDVAGRGGQVLLRIYRVDEQPEKGYNKE